MNPPDAYCRKVKQKLDAWEAQIDLLLANADRLEGGKRIMESQRTLALLHRRETVCNKLARLERAPPERQRQAELDLASAWAQLKEAWRGVEARLPLDEPSHASGPPGS